MALEVWTVSNSLLHIQRSHVARLWEIVLPGSSCRSRVFYFQSPYLFLISSQEGKLKHRALCVTFLDIFRLEVLKCHFELTYLRLFVSNSPPLLSYLKLICMKTNCRMNEHLRCCYERSTNLPLSFEKGKLCCWWLIQSWNRATEYAMDGTNFSEYNIPRWSKLVTNLILKKWNIPKVLLRLTNQFLR